MLTKEYEDAPKKYPARAEYTTLILRRALVSSAIERNLKRQVGTADAIVVEESNNFIYYRGKGTAAQCLTQSRMILTYFSRGACCGLPTKDTSY